MAIFEKYNINYRAIFKVPDDYRPKSVDLLKIAGLHTSVYLVLFLLYLLDVTKVYSVKAFGSEYYALICWGLFILFICAPIPKFYSRGRFLLLKLLLQSIISPFVDVTFPIAWMTDQLVSMALPLKDL